MNKADATEANGIVQRTLINLSKIIVGTGNIAVQTKMVIGWVSANALSLLAADQLATPLDTCFDLVRQTGCTLQQMEQVRVLLDVESPLSLGANMVRDRSIHLALAQEGKIVTTMVFTSRQDVDALILAIQTPFNTAEEVAADTMSGADYIALIELRAAIVNHLVATARPLPSMLSYQFAQSLPTLIISQRLYGDASHYDEIRNENKVVHPAFCPMNGQALSSAA
jgi:prophage DNA circulation protein